MKKINERAIIISLFMILVLFFILSLIYLNLQSRKHYQDKECDYDTKDYVGKSTEKCATTKFLCAPGFEEFQDECGCGCQIVSQLTPVPKLEEHFCTQEQRQADVCIQLYKPVCGWFNPEKIQCIKYPCANTYSNSCFACTNPDVLYWTEGECPK